MTQIAEAIARYHHFFEEEGYRDLAWAQALQDRMRQQKLTDSGRLISPVLRPQFISKSELGHLMSAAERLYPVIERATDQVAQTPALLNRLHLLPAEKMLATVPANRRRVTVACRMDVQLQNGSVFVHGLNTCKPKGLAYGDELAKLFLELAIVKAFKRGRYRVSKLQSRLQLHSAVLQAWADFGGATAPNVAVLEFGDASRSHSEETDLLVQVLTRTGLSCRRISPDRLDYTKGKLRHGEFEIGVVFRRLVTRDLLGRFDLSHPLFAAYRAGAVCVVNDFRSEIAQRPAFFDLLTDEDAIPSLSSADRKLLRAFVPWTRVASHRKTSYKEQTIDLPEFIVQNRERLSLLPNDDSGGYQSFIGAHMKQTAWENAVRTALRVPYVAQEHMPNGAEPFPVYQYGQLQMRQAQVSVQPHLVNGMVHGVTAGLATYLTGCATPFGMAPVLLLENN